MRLIDAEAFETDVRKRYCKGCGNSNGIWCRTCWVDDMLGEIEDAPTIEAKPVVYAHWDEVSGGRIICTSCDNYPLYDYFGRLFLSRTCPTCGALMDNGGHWLFRRAEEYLKENSCDHIAEAGKKENNP